jgi:hypothetical protein
MVSWLKTKYHSTIPKYLITQAALREGIFLENSMKNKVNRLRPVFGEKKSQVILLA